MFNLFGKCRAKCWPQPPKIWEKFTEDPNNTRFEGIHSALGQLSHFDAGNELLQQQKMAGHVNPIWDQGFLEDVHVNVPMKNWKTRIHSDRRVYINIYSMNVYIYNIYIVQAVGNLWGHHTVNPTKLVLRAGVVLRGVLRGSSRGQVFNL